MLNKKYTATIKNGGNIPPIPDKRVRYVPIGCGKCIECRKQKAREWNVRLSEDIREHKNGKFITLTFSDEKLKDLTENVQEEHARVTEGEMLEGYDLDNAICIYAVRHWLERYRKEYGTSVRHWLITEIGHKGTKNIHMHGIVWPTESLKDTLKHWQYGYVWDGQKKNDKIINYVSERTINYIVKYMHKVDKVNQTYNPRVLCSKGIGAGYMKRTDWKNNQYKGTSTNEAYRNRQGIKRALPIYYRNKIYTETQKEQLWIHKLDKEERWVCGEKVSIRDGQKEYETLVEYYQKRSIELGYTPLPTWERHVYEKQRRRIEQETRIQKAIMKQKPE